VEGWKGKGGRVRVRVEGGGGVEGWKGKGGRVEGWKEGWKGGGVEGWKGGRVEGSGLIGLVWVSVGWDGLGECAKMFR